jgi:uncharacterized protein
MTHELKQVKEEPWYKDGLHFKCTGCGKCCTGSPGFVWLTEDDIEKLCGHFNLSKADFLEKYARKVNKKYSLKEDDKTYDCVFLKEGKYCQVYKDRPIQCKTYPYWLENLHSKKDWDNKAKFCEGINHKDAELVSYDDIKKQLLKSLKTRSQN